MRWTRRSSSASLATMSSLRCSIYTTDGGVNSGKAGWLVVSRRIVVAYEHPDGEDPLSARIVTVWRGR